MEKLYKVSKAITVMFTTYIILFLTTGILTYILNYTTLFNVSETIKTIFGYFGACVLFGVIPVVIAYRVMQSYIVNYAPENINKYVLDDLLTGCYKRAKEFYELTV